MTLDNQTEERLDRFLKDNRPEAPDAKSNEWQGIVAAIEAEKTKKGLNWWKIAVPALIAASLAVVIITPILRNDKPVTVAANDTELEEFLDETIGTLYGANGFDTDLNIGSDWLSLAE